MGHGDTLVIADSNFPSDSTSAHCVVKTPVRVNGLTSEVLKDILVLFPLDEYVPKAISVMDRVDGDKQRELAVPAYERIALAANKSESDLEFVERFEFYDRSKCAFAIVQTDDRYLKFNIKIDFTNELIFTSMA